MFTIDYVTQNDKEFWFSLDRHMSENEIMTSTQVNEDAQHFYRKIGFKDAGCLVLDIQGMNNLWKCL